MPDYNHMLKHASAALHEVRRMQVQLREMYEAAARIEDEMVKAMDRAQALQERAPLTSRKVR